MINDEIHPLAHAGCYLRLRASEQKSERAAEGKLIYDSSKLERRRVKSKQLEIWRGTRKPTLKEELRVDVHNVICLQGQPFHFCLMSTLIEGSTLIITLS